MKFVLLLIISLSCPALAADDWFASHEQQGRWAFYQQHYDKAARLFKQPYRQGVALYRAQHYADAVVAFKQNQNPKLHIAATYNLGNAYFQMAQYVQAIQSYERVLAETEHTDAEYNLALARQLLALQQKEKAPVTPLNDSSAQQPQDETNESQNKSPSNSQTNQQLSATAESGSRTDEQQTTHSEPLKGELHNIQPEQQLTSVSAISEALPKPPEDNNPTTANRPSPNQDQPPQQVSDVLPDFIPTESEATLVFEQQTEPTVTTNTPLEMPTQFSEQQINHLLSQVEAEPQRLLKNQFRLEALRQQQHLIEERPW